MKTVLILVLSAEEPPYGKMILTQMRTWDSIEVEGVETLYYCGVGDSQRDKVFYTGVKHSYHSMGYKTLAALEYVFSCNTFDYIARVNSSTYVDKKALIKYIQTLPGNNLFMGGEVVDNPRWMWGGYQFIYSKDVARKILDNKDKWKHDSIEDKAISCLADELNIPFTQIQCSCSINKNGNEWLCISSINDNFYFDNFEDVKAHNNCFYRVKQDHDRNIDEYIMNELFKVLK